MHCIGGAVRSTGDGFKSYSGQSCATTLGKLFTPMFFCHQAYNCQGVVMLCGWEGNRRHGRK